MSEPDPLRAWHVFVARSADPEATARAFERNVGLDARKLLLAVRVSLILLAEAIEDGNDHLFPEMTAQQIRDLAERAGG